MSGLRKSGVLVVWLVALYGCGGGGGGGGGSTGSSGAPPTNTTDQDPTGAWKGTATLSIDPVATYQVTMITDEGGGGYFFIGPYNDSKGLPRYAMLLEAGLLTQGANLRDGNPGRAWTQRRFSQDDPDLRFESGFNYAEGTMSGRVSERSSMQLTWTSVDGDMAEFSVTYDADLYEREIDISTLAGAWGNELVNLTIDSDGRGSGQYVDQQGSCAFSFTLAPSSLPVNFFRSTLGIGECQGYVFLTLRAFMSDAGGQNNRLNIFLRGRSGSPSKAASLTRN